MPYYKPTPWTHHQSRLICIGMQRLTILRFPHQIHVAVVLVLTAWKHLIATASQVAGNHKAQLTSPV